jgi:TfoX/Sxy family transcriptional regulator of competence genes
MKWEKPSLELVELFDSILPTDIRVERQKMFGYPCAFTNGNMFCGMHNKTIVVRLSESKRAELIKKNWQQFEPMPGRIMKEYLIIPEDILQNKTKAAAMLSESLEFVYTIPPKKKKGSR